MSIRHPVLSRRQGVIDSTANTPHARNEVAALWHRACFTFQMSEAYSAIVRSLENFPEPATFSYRLCRPSIRVGVQVGQSAVCVQIGVQIRQVHVEVAAVRSTSRSGLKTPGSFRLK